MSKAFYSVLQGALALLAAILNDPEVRAFLMSVGFPMDWVSQGNSMVEGAQAVVSRKLVLLEQRKGAGEAVRQMLKNLRKEVNALRFVAARAFSPRPDLLEAYSLKRRRKAKAQADAPKPPVADPKGASEGASKEEPADRAPAGTPVGRFVGKARALLMGILEDGGAVSLLSPYGYGEQQLQTLLSRIDALVARDLELQTAKAGYTSAVAEVRVKAKEFRTWFMPWRKLLMKALATRPDLLAKLGLPVPKPRVNHKKKDAQVDATETANAKTDNKPGPMVGTGSSTHTTTESGSSPTPHTTTTPEAASPPKA